jgi:hypothetical protein
MASQRYEDSLRHVEEKIWECNFKIGQYRELIADWCADDERAEASEIIAEKAIECAQEQVRKNLFQTILSEGPNTVVQQCIRAISHWSSTSLALGTSPLNASRQQVAREVLNFTLSEFHDDLLAPVLIEALHQRV